MFVARDYADGRKADNIGYANFHMKILNSNQEVVYPNASLQKVMTGAMIVQLINETSHSKDPVTQNSLLSRWYPNMKKANQITVGNLMTQTSGIIDTKSESYSGKVLSESAAIEATVHRINHNGLASKGIFRYNNDNYILLAGIIRKVTGKSYAQNFESRIVRRLGLDSTYMWNTVPGKRVKAVSYLYSAGKDYKHAKEPKNNLLSYILGAGNIYTTPEDYYKFQQGLQNGKILNASDYHYLTNLKTKNGTYSGGLYIQSYKHGDGTIKMVYGSLNADNYGNWVELTSGNKKGIIMFLNQTDVVDHSVESPIKSAGLKILDQLNPNIFR